MYCINGCIYKRRTFYEHKIQHFKEIETQCMPFYYRLARFVALTLDKNTALEKGFVFDAEGEPVFSKENNKKTDKYFKELLGVSKRVLRYWKTLEDYAMFRRSNRNRFFKLAFVLGLNASETNKMFNKLFAHPAFIREPEALIFMRCLDKKETFIPSVTSSQRIAEAPFSTAEDTNLCPSV